MRLAKQILLSFILIFAPVLSLGQPQAAPLHNDDILKLINGGLQESTIVSAIQAADTNFDLSVEELLSLRQAGVPDKVLNAMLASQTAKKNATGNNAAEPEPAAQLPSQSLSRSLSPEMMASMSPSARQQIAAMMSRVSSMGMPRESWASTQVLGLPPSRCPKSRSSAAQTRSRSQIP